MVVHVSRNASFLPPASALVADVPTGVNGDGPGDNNAEGVDDANVSAWSHVPRRPVFQHMEESKRLGRWTTLASGFCPLRRDPCLHAAFVKFSKDNSSVLDEA